MWLSELIMILNHLHFQYGNAYNPLAYNPYGGSYYGNLYGAYNPYNSYLGGAYNPLYGGGVYGNLGLGLPGAFGYRK